jgi:hypothetical protein
VGCSRACRRLATLLSRDSWDRFLAVGPISYSTAALRARGAFQLWFVANSSCLSARSCIRGPSSYSGHRGREEPCAAQHRIVSTQSASYSSKHSAARGMELGRRIYLLLAAFHAGLPSGGGHGGLIGLAGLHTRSLVLQRYSVSLLNRRKQASVRYKKVAEHDPHLEDGRRC